MEIYAIMESCWAQEPETRPTFGELVKKLSSLFIIEPQHVVVETQQQQPNLYHNQ